MPFVAHAWALVGLLGLYLTIWHRDAASALLSTGQYDVAQRTFGVGNGHLADKIERRVVAVADLHGDLQHAHNVLRMAGLIDEDVVPNWIGGTNVLVSTGDIVDRGDDTIALYEMFQRLRVQAEAKGGQVLNCIGNHEMMNALLDWRYVTQGDMDSFGGAKHRREVMSIEGWIGTDWTANYSISHTIELLPSSLLPDDVRGKYAVPRANFVHGGIHATWAAKSLQHINAVGHSLLSKALANPKPDGWLPSDASEEEAQFYDQNGPLWYRGYATKDEQQVCQEAEHASKHLSVRHLVMGHTPHLSGFVVRCKATVLLIDTGISKAYGGEQSALLFDTTLQRADDNKKIWREESRITALYRGRMPRLLDQKNRDIEM